MLKFDLLRCQAEPVEALLRRNLQRVEFNNNGLANYTFQYM